MKKTLKTRLQEILTELKSEVPDMKHYLINEIQRIVGETRRELATKGRQRETAAASTQLLTGRLAKLESQVSEANEKLKSTKSSMELLRSTKDEYEKQAKELDWSFSMLQEIVENSLPKIVSNGVRKLVFEEDISENFIAFYFLRSAFWWANSGHEPTLARVRSECGGVTVIVHTGEWHEDEDYAVRFFLPDEFTEACPEHIRKELKSCHAP